MRAAVLLAVVLLLGGCGGGDRPAAPAKAAEPARSPAVSATPAGRVVPLAPDPEGMVFDPVTGLLAVAVRSPDRLLLVDGATGAVRREVRLPGHARHLQLAAPGGPVLVPAEDADTLVEVSLPDGGTTAVEVGRYPHDAAQLPDGRLLVGDELGGTLSVVTDGRVTATLTDQRQPGGVAVSGDVAGVVDVGAFTLSTYDVAAARRTAVVGAGRGPTHVVAGGRGRFLVADTRGNAVLVFSAAPLRPATRFALPGTPYGLAYDPARQLLWVTLTATNEVVALSAAGDRLTEVARLRTVRQPDTVAVDPGSGRVFVAGRTTGQLQVVDGG